MDSTKFIFDGKDSEDFGLNIIKIDGGFYPTPYTAGQHIIEDSVPNKHINYFYGVKKEVFQFDVIFSLLEEKFTDDKKYDLARWLIHEEYKPFQSFDNLDKIYYVIAINQSDIMTGGNREGYFTITFRTNVPWAYTREVEKTYDLLSITEPIDIIIVNKSNAVKYYYPEIEIEVGAGETDIELINKSNNDKVFKFEDLDSSEIIYVDNAKHRIISSEDDTVLSRLGNFNKGWLELPHGINKIQVNNKCKIKLRTQFPIYV